MYVKGPWTGADLSEAASLFRQREGASGDSAPNLAPHSLQLSYELAAAAYTMDQAVWHQAGWQDFSLIVNGSLITGAALNSGDTPLNDLTRATLQTLARLKKSALNPIGQYMGLRQAEEETESLKAIVMLLPQDGLYIVAVGFMGTGKQLGDWTPNFRMEEEAGLHEGFLQLSQEFENQLEHITFTHAAGLLGRDSLTLQDVIGEMKRPGSIFRLWISGHSQGAAVMQVFVDRLLSAGVRREYLCGMGFASPTVAHPNKALPADGYPMTHILNGDDLVPRLGAWRHLGGCLTFQPQEADRLRIYGAQASEPCFREIQRQLQSAKTAPENIINGLAVLRVLRRHSDLTLTRVFDETELKPVTGLLNAGNVNIQKLLEGLSAPMERGYLAVSGEAALPEDALERSAGVWEDILRRYGAPAWLRGLRDAMILPHRLYKSAPEGTAAYLYIVTEGLRGLLGDSACVPILTSGAEVRPAVKTVFPGFAGRRIFRPVLPGKADPPAVPDPPAMPEPPTAPDPPAAPQSKAVPKPSRTAKTITPLELGRLHARFAAYRLLSVKNRSKDKR